MMMRRLQARVTKEEEDKEFYEDIIGRQLEPPDDFITGRRSSADFCENLIYLQR